MAIGCAGTQHLKEGEYILYKQNIEADKQIDADALKKLHVQLPNKRILFLPISFYTFLYYTGEKRYDTAKYAVKSAKIANKFASKAQKNPDKVARQSRLNQRLNKKNDKIAKSLKEGNLFMRWGEPVSVLDSVNLDKTVDNIKSYVEGKGWFRTQVDYSTTIKNKKATIQYSIIEGPRYYFDTLFYGISDQNLSALMLKHQDEQLIEIGKPYDNDVLGKERDRLDELFKNNGYFDFSKQYINFQVDTTYGEHKVAVKMSILLPEKKNQHSVYTIDSVIFTTDATIQEAGVERQYTIFKSTTYQYYQRRYSEKVLNRRVYLRPGQLYSKANTLTTQRELARMENFKFVNVNYDTTGGKFIANIFVSPLERYQWSNEIGLSVTQGYPGPFFNMSLKRRNILKRLGTLELDLRVGLEGVAAASNPDDILASLEAGGNIGVTFPQFFLPLSEKNQQKLGFIDPKTNVKAGVTYTARPEYTRFEVSASNSYRWKSKKDNNYIFKLIDIGLIRTPQIDSLYEARLKELQDKGNNLINSFLPSFLSSVNLTSLKRIDDYGATLNRSSFFSYSVEPGGTLTNIFENSLDTGFFASRGLETYAYVKFDVDYRKMIPTGRNRGWAYKIKAGMAIPYGANGILPYETYFFAGGSISNRAWKPRRLGPGSFNHIDEGQVSYQFEQPGEILLEMSLEYRQRLYKFIQWAFFIDAGNIWMIKEDPARPGAQFEGKDFYKEIAFGSGVGLRLDFSFLLVRFDVGLKVYDPARPLGSRFILDSGFNNAPFNDPKFTEPVIWTLAIGYPF